MVTTAATSSVIQVERTDRSLIHSNATTSCARAASEGASG